MGTFFSEFQKTKLPVDSRNHRLVNMMRQSKLGFASLTTPKSQWLEVTMANSLFIFCSHYMSIISWLRRSCSIVTFTLGPRLGPSGCQDSGKRRSCGADSFLKCSPRSDMVPFHSHMTLAKASYADTSNFK